MEAFTVNSFGFSTLDDNELIFVDGGVNWGQVAAGVGGSLLIVAGACSVIVGGGVAIGTGGAAVLPGVKLAGAGVTAIIAGTKLLNTVNK